MFQQEYTDAELTTINSKLESKAYGSNEKGCKLWLGALNKRGYGKIRFPKLRDNMGLQPNNAVLVHRLIYFVHIRGAPMDDYMHVSHICHVKNRLACHLAVF